VVPELQGQAWRPLRALRRLAKEKAGPRPVRPATVLKNKAMVIFGTEDELVEAMNFLKENSQELREDIVGRSGR